MIAELLEGIMVQLSIMTKMLEDIEHLLRRSQDVNCIAVDKTNEEEN